MKRTYRRDDGRTSGRTRTFDRDSRASARAVVDRLDGGLNAIAGRAMSKMSFAVAAGAVSCFRYGKKGLSDYREMALDVLRARKEDEQAKLTGVEERGERTLMNIRGSVKARLIGSVLIAGLSVAGISQAIIANESVKAAIITFGAIIVGCVWAVADLPISYIKARRKYHREYSDTTNVVKRKLERIGRVEEQVARSSSYAMENDFALQRSVLDA